MTGTLNKDVKITLKAVNRLGPSIRKAESQLKSFREGATRMAVKAGAAMGAAMVVGLTAAIVVGADFEQQMANVGSVAQATASEMQALESQARKMGATTAFSASQAGEAMYSLASGGLEANEIISSSEGVLKLAGATLADMGSTAELTMVSMRSFGLAAEDTDRIVNVLAAGITSSMLTMERLSNSMKFAAPIASALGMSIEETTASLALLHNAGLRGSLAGTGLRMTLIRLIKPSDDLKRALEGISVEKDGIEVVLGKLKSLNLTGEQMATYFGPRAFGAIKALTDAGSEGFGRMLAKVTGTNSAFEMYQRQMDTTTGRFKILKSAMQENLISVFEAIKPAVDDSLKKMIYFVQHAKPALVGLGVDVREAFLSLRSSMIGVFDYLKSNESTVKTAAENMLKLSVAVYAVATALKVVTVAMATASAVARGWALAVSAAETLAIFVLLNPVLAAIVAGVIAVGIGIALLIEKMGGMKVAMIEASAGMKIAWAYINAGVKIAWVGVVEFGSRVATVFAALWDRFDWLGDAWRWVGDLAQKSMAKTIAAFRKLGEWILSSKDFIVALGATIGTVMARVWDSIKLVVSKTGQAFADLGSIIMNPFKAKELWLEMKKGLSEGWDDAFGGMPEEVEAHWAIAGVRSKAKLEQINGELKAQLIKIDGERKALLASLASDRSNESAGDPIEVIRARYEVMVNDFKLQAAALRQIFKSMGFAAGGSGRLASGFNEVAAQGKSAMDILNSSAATAFSGITESITASVMDGKRKLIELGEIGRSVFNSLLGGFLKFGMIAGLKALGPTGVAIAGFLATGGPAIAGQSYVVGENGPEIFTPSASGFVTPNHRIGVSNGGVKSGGSGGSVQQSSGDTIFHISAPINVPSGSLLVADNRMAIRRIGEQVANVITEKIEKTYRS